QCEDLGHDPRRQASRRRARVSSRLACHAATRRPQTPRAPAEASRAPRAAGTRPRPPAAPRAGQGPQRALAVLRARRPRRPRGSLRGRALVLVVVAGGLAIAYFGWFRDSSLVAVRDVKVDGVTGSDRARIVGALTDAAKGMTTLHVQAGRL